MLEDQENKVETLKLFADKAHQFKNVLLSFQYALQGSTDDTLAERAVRIDEGERLRRSHILSLCTPGGLRLQISSSYHLSPDVPCAKNI